MTGGFPSSRGEEGAKEARRGEPPAGGGSRKRLRAAEVKQEK